MDSTIREKLEEQLGEYILDTLKYTETVKQFCDGKSKWTSQRKTELDKMTGIKAKAEDKNQTWGQYIWKSLTNVSSRPELEKELEEVLNNTLEGLEELQHVLDAVEKLAVTSLDVFMDDSFSSMSVRSVIFAAITVSPLLVHFKRDARAFFLPSLSNVEVLVFQLDKYIRITQQIIEKMEEGRSRSVSGSGGVHEWKNRKSSRNLILNVSEESAQDLYDHLLQLTKIRKDESFRMNFLFDVKAQDFIFIFRERYSRMLEFLSDLEKAAVELDKMKKGSNISTVAGSSVGIAGGVLSIVGLALAPVTAGASLALTLTGVGLGVTSGVNGIVTGITEIAVNSHQGKKANDIFLRFMEDVQKILECVEDVASREVTEARTLAASAGSVAQCFDDIVVAASTVNAVRAEDVVTTTADLSIQNAKAVRNIPQLVADLPDIGQMAKGTSLALSKSARAGFIALNALFIGVDVFFICKDSMSLTKGSKNEVAQIIRSRSALWRSEVEAWEKIYNRLFEGIAGSYKNKEILEQPLYSKIMNYIKMLTWQ
ncbi:apolipoprotein L1 isoform X2 [Ictalurus punctatus]|uniref:Apolipoprotein L1 isoform X1 n=1 Tax=Ictalurus punctatus TaxID=7998 RepID=A0A9F7QYQ0_ICTPU|nr:apolipoprotein L1 isoform X1 [Ictalurus punctatus]XP_053529732.1 apolipoprotein L1 isoform X2 [Ictalurus punctatus]